MSEALYAVRRWDESLALLWATEVSVRADGALLVHRGEQLIAAFDAGDWDALAILDDPRCDGCRGASNHERKPV